MYFWSLLHKSFRSQALYFFEFLISNMQFVLQGVLTILIGLYTNSVTQSYSELELLQYYAFGVGFLLFFTRNYIVRNFEEEVVNATLITKLVRPYNFLLFVVLRNLTHLLPKAIMSFSIFIIIMSIFFTFPLTLPVVFRSFIGILFALSMVYLVAAIFCQLALILERVDDLFRIVVMAIFFAGGGFIPLAMLPSFIQYLPTSFIYFHPLNYIISGNYAFAILGFTYAIILLLINIVLYKKIRKHIEVNG